MNIAHWGPKWSNMIKPLHKEGEDKRDLTLSKQWPHPLLAQRYHQNPHRPVARIAEAVTVTPLGSLALARLIKLASSTSTSSNSSNLECDTNTYTMLHAPHSQSLLLQALLGTTHCPPALRAIGQSLSQASAIGKC